MTGPPETSPWQSNKSIQTGTAAGLAQKPETCHWGPGTPWHPRAQVTEKGVDQGVDTKHNHSLARNILIEKSLQWLSMQESIALTHNLLISDPFQQNLPLPLPTLSEVPS